MSTWGWFAISILGLALVAVTVIQLGWSLWLILVAFLVGVIAALIGVLLKIGNNMFNF